MTNDELAIAERRLVSDFTDALTQVLERRTTAIVQALDSDDGNPSPPLSRRRTHVARRPTVQRLRPSGQPSPGSRSGQKSPSQDVDVACQPNLRPSSSPAPIEPIERARSPRGATRPVPGDRPEEVQVALPSPVASFDF